MAYPNRALILALEATHAKLKTSPLYAWGHLGACNCGHLAQVVTRKSAAEIHRLAVRRAGDWERWPSIIVHKVVCRWTISFRRCSIWG